MAIRTVLTEQTYGALDVQTNVRRAAPAITRSGNVYVASGTAVCLASDSNGSIYRLAQIPSWAILRETSQIDLQSWGFTIARVGIESDTDALLSVANTAGLSAVSTFFAFGAATWNKQLWEQLGLSEDPRQMIDISIFTEADAGGAGTAPFAFEYQAV